MMKVQSYFKEKYSILSYVKICEKRIGNQDHIFRSFQKIFNP